MIQHHRTINSQRPINLVTRAEVEKNAPLRSLQFEYILCYFGMCNFNLEVMTERKFFCYVCDAFFVLHLSLSRLATDVVDVGLLCEEFICVVLQNKKKVCFEFLRSFEIYLLFVVCNLLQQYVEFKLKFLLLKIEVKHGNIPRLMKIKVRILKL